MVKLALLTEKGELPIKCVVHDFRATVNTFPLPIKCEQKLNECFPRNEDIIDIIAGQDVLGQIVIEKTAINRLDNGLNILPTIFGAVPCGKFETDGEKDTGNLFWGNVSVMERLCKILEKQWQLDKLDHDQKEEISSEDLAALEKMKQQFKFLKQAYFSKQSRKW